MKAILICALFCLLGLNYVWQKRLIYGLGQQRQKLETRLKVIREENKRRRDTLDHFRSYTYLDNKVRELKLGLVVPLPEQVVTLSDWPITTTTPTPVPHRRQLVAQANPPRRK